MHRGVVVKKGFIKGAGRGQKHGMSIRGEIQRQSQQVHKSRSKPGNQNNV